jgi:hypothetical protein
MDGEHDRDVFRRDGVKICVWQFQSPTGYNLIASMAPPSHGDRPWSTMANKGNKKAGPRKVTPA